MSQDRIKTRVISLKVLLSKDPNEIVEIQIFVWRICDQPRLRLIRFSKTKVMVTFKHMGLRVLPRTDYTIYVEQILSGELLSFSLH